MIRRSLPILGLALVFSVPAAAQYSIDWYTIDGGGGTSSAGALRLDGTIGQPDAGRATGGDFELVGGFWAIVPTSDTPGGDVDSDYMFIGSPAESEEIEDGVADAALEVEIAAVTDDSNWALF